MGSVHTDVPDDEQSFHYQPLANPGSSIRLIEIDPDTSSNGSIQIRMFDSPLTEDYTCLSYVWGPESDRHFRIIINGETLNVRRNLHDFLCIARKKYPRRKLWIDAICINQADTDERNQQVQQMGEIYSGAREVIAWLGNRPQAALFIPLINSKFRYFFKFLPVNIITNPSYRSILFLPSMRCFPIKSFIWDRWSFSNAIKIYWERAWVTQEVTLAKHVRLLIHDTELELSALTPSNMRYLDSTVLGDHELAEMRLANIQYHHHNDKQYLLQLLSAFGDKKCAVGRDRIFSLLAICAEKEDLEVDYDLFEDKLMSNVLRASRLTPCLCSAYVVSRSIDVDAIPERNLRLQYFVKFTVQATDVHIYRAKKRKLPSCCSEFSNKFSTEQADGQIFCLHGVCPLIKSHLFLVSGGPEKHLVKGIMSDWRDKNRMNIPLGENGELVNICPSPQGNSYIIKFDLKVLLALPTISFDAMGPIEYILGIESPLCLRARHNFTDHSVEYLDIGAKDEESIEEDFP